MIKKYMTGWFARGQLIEPVEIERETEASVFINGQRHAKESEHAQYHASFEDAKKFLLEKAERELSSARRKLESAQGFYGNVKGLKEK